MTTDFDRAHGRPWPCRNCGAPWSAHHGKTYACPIYGRVAWDGAAKYERDRRKHPSVDRPASQAPRHGTSNSVSSSDAVAGSRRFGGEE